MHTPQGCVVGERVKLRSADALLVPQVRAALEVLGLEPQDVAAAGLALRYASEIDGAGPERSVAVIEKLGPRLLACLTDLGATPRGRRGPAPVVEGGDDGGAPVQAESALARLRGARR